MNEQHWTVDVAGVETTVRHERVADGRATLVFGHGAGSDMDHPRTRALVAALGAAGCDVASYNFLYRAVGKGAPDRMPKLQACLQAVIASVRARTEPRRLLLGGHSMGGRVASMLAADGAACDGLVLLGYPLHPAGKPERLRTAHLGRIAVPVLCCNGTRDALCTPDLMRAAIADLSNWTMHWLDGADHGYQVLKRSGRTEAEVLAEITATVAIWLRGGPGSG